MRRTTWLGYFLRILLYQQLLCSERYENHWKSTKRLVVFFHPHSPGTVLIIRRDILFPLELAALRHCTTRTHQYGYILLLYYIHCSWGSNCDAPQPLIAAEPGQNFMNETCTIFYLWTVHAAARVSYIILIQ